MIRKIRFFAKLYIYRLQGFLGLKRFDIMPAVNDYYSNEFRKLNKKDVAVILPHCLIHDKCPARFSKSDGIICNECNLCGCSKIFESAREKGYQFYITPSVGFTKRLVQRKKLKGVIGVACDYEIEKGINSEKITAIGVKIGEAGVKTLGVRLKVYDCIQNNVDWEMILKLM